VSGDPAAGLRVCKRRTSSGVEEAAGVEQSMREPRGERRSGWAADPPPQECASGDDLPHLQLTLRRLLEPLQWLQHLQNPVAARVAEAPGDSLAKRAPLLPCSSSLAVAGCRAARNARSGILCSVGQRFCSDFGQSPFVLVRKSRKIFFRSGPSVPRAM
jgi:hypothetical protein